MSDSSILSLFTKSRALALSHHTSFNKTGEEEEGEKTGVILKDGERELEEKGDS